jgi:hypothetical protein
MTSTVWDRERIARELLSERERLQRRLPGEIHAARDLEEWVREDIVVAAITHVVMDHPRPIHNRDELERTLWAACAHRVRRAHEGRYDLVRGRFQRASADVLDTVADGDTPEDAALERENLAHALDFAAMLTPLERRVHAAKYLEGERERGYKQIARALGETIGAVRAAERSIGVKQERFAAILSAGRLCDFQAPGIASLAAGDATEHQATAAHVHLQGCASCRTHFKRHLRYLRTARFHDNVNQLLPPVVVSNDRRTGVRDLVADWAARLLGHDTPAAATQLAAGGAGRGIGTAAALKLASLCLGAGTLGVCAVTVGPLKATHHKPPAKVAAKSPTPTPTPTATEPPRPHGGLVVTPTPTPKKTPRKRSTATAKTQGGTGATSHEQTPASQARTGSAAGGASEFNPTDQSGPASPAPVPAAPGGSEFQ